MSPTDAEFAELNARVATLERAVSFLLAQVGSTYHDNPPTSEYPEVLELKRQGKIIEAIKVYRGNKRAQAGQVENHRLANLINDFETARFYRAIEPSRLSRLFDGCGDHYVANAVSIRLGR